MVFPFQLSREMGFRPSSPLRLPHLKFLFVCFDPGAFGRFDLAALVQPHLKFFFVCLFVMAQYGLMAITYYFEAFYSWMHVWD